MPSTWTKVFAALSIITVATFGSAGDSFAAPVIFSGLDNRIGPGEPAPNSIAAALAFDTAAPPSTVITFEGLPLGFPSGPLTPVPGVTLTLSGDSFISSANNDPLDFGYNTTPGGSEFLQPARNFAHNNVVFSFAEPVASFGFYLTGSETDFNRLTLTFDDGTAEELTVIRNSDGGIAFYGFTDFGRSFSSVSVNDLTGPAGDLVGIDDVRFQIAPTVVPEPSSAALLCFGLLSLVMIRIAPQHFVQSHGASRWHWQGRLAVHRLGQEGQGLAIEARYVDALPHGRREGFGGFNAEQARLGPPVRHVSG